MFAYIIPMSELGGGHPSHPIFMPGTPEHPIVQPPPGVWPPPGGGGGLPSIPPGIWPSPTPPGAHPAPPIFIPGTPEHPIALPPGVVWPPLQPPEAPAGKMVVLVFIPGHGWHYIVVDTSLEPTPVVAPKR